MATKDIRVDRYIARAGAFARPILTHIRSLVHRAVPEVEETIKWGFPHFVYHGILCSMAAFTSHCAMTFRKAPLLDDPGKILEKAGMRTAMGHLGRIRSRADLPADRALLAVIRSAAKLNMQPMQGSKSRKGRTR